MKPENRQKIVDLIYQIVVIFIASMALIGTFLVAQQLIMGKNQQPQNNNISSENNKKGVKEKTSTTTENKITDFEKYISYTHFSVYPDGLMTNEEIIDNYSEVYKKYSKKIKTSGKFNDAYLYIKAEAGSPGKSLNEAEYASIYGLLYSPDYSGQLIRRLSLIEQNNDNHTELLYNLGSIPTTHIPYDDNATPDKSVNATNLLNLDQQMYVGSFVSISVDKNGKQRYGKILEMTIAYKCAQGSDCKIE